MLRAVLVAVLAVCGWFADPAASRSADVLPAAPVAAYAYDAPHYTDPLSDHAPERGPPSSPGDSTTTHAAVDLWLHGPSMRSGPTTSLTATTYDPALPLVQIASAATPNDGAAEVTWSGLSSPLPSHIAAKGRDDLTRVGRWMGDDQLAKMQKTGLVQEGSGGRTFVTNPADLAAFPAGKGVFRRVQRSDELAHSSRQTGVVSHPGPECGNHPVRPTAESDAAGNVHRCGVPPMTYTDRLADWVAVNRELLEQHGQVSFSRRPLGTDNPSAHLLVALSADEDAELLVWESGDAEFNHGSFDASVFEHLELESPGEMADLLARFLRLVTGAS